MVATGRLDAVEMIAWEPRYIASYYQYLNAGYRLPLVGGTDKMTAEVTVGQVRTYAAVPPDTPNVWKDWLDAIRRGACYATSGPLLDVTIGDVSPGGEIIVQTGAEVIVCVEATSIFPLERLELIANGEVIATAVGHGVERLKLRHSFEPANASWVAARAFAGPAMRNHHDIWARRIMAHSSPIYIGCEAPYARYDAETLRHMRTLCEGIRLHVCHLAATRWPGAVLHRHREADHLAYLVRPLDEALACIDARLADGV